MAKDGGTREIQIGCVNCKKGQNINIEGNHNEIRGKGATGDVEFNGSGCLQHQKTDNSEMFLGTWLHWHKQFETGRVKWTKCW